MNSKAGVIIVIIAIIILGGTLLILNRPSPKQKITPQTIATTPTPALPKEITVTLTEKNGFIPKQVTLKVGNAVKWTNSDVEKATVNSDDHPTHRKFPEMNLGEFKKGESLTQVFTKPGTYTYHNHYNPSSKGIIVVQ